MLQRSSESRMLLCAELAIYAGLDDYPHAHSLPLALTLPVGRPLLLHFPADLLAGDGSGEPLRN